MVKVKICGITREEDLRAAVDAGADLLGFVVGVPASPRNLLFPRARYLTSKVPESVNSVAVTVFKTLSELVQIHRELKTDYIQLHGNFYHIRKPITELPSRNCIIGAVNARAANALDLATEFSGIFQYVLLDTTGNGGVGGTGITHDWSLSKRIRDAIHPTPLILAGGLTPTNVSRAIGMVKPDGVDVSSGVEKKPGIKDHEKMFNFIAEVKRKD